MLFCLENIVGLGFEHSSIFENVVKYMDVFGALETLVLIRSVHEM